MLPNPLFPSDQHVVNCLINDYGLEVSNLTLLPLGADINALVYKAQTEDQSSYFVKLKFGRHPNNSAIIIEFLHNAGIQQVIYPFKTIGGQFFQSLEDFTLMIFPFIEGQDGFSQDLTTDQWITLGKTMRKIHDIDVPLSIQTLIRRETYTPQWRETVRSLYSYIEADPMSDEVARELQRFMKQNKLIIQHLVDRAEQLEQQIHNIHQLVLCHADIHGGNVLIDKNDNIFIVDWDEPVMAPKERDLMFIGGGVANVWNKLEEEEFFYKGYGKTEVDKTLLAYYRYERILEDIAIYGQQLLLNKEGGQDRKRMYEQFLAQFDPRGVVDIAFNTDKVLL